MQARIAICADTHRKIDDLCFELSQIKDISRIIHLGDHVSDAEEMELILNRPIIKVRGNNDYMDLDTPNNLVLDIGSHRIFLTHGHLFGVYNGLENIIEKAKREDCDICLFGHTHAYMSEEISGIRIINPGSTCRARGDFQKSFVIMDIEDDGALTIKRVIL